MNGELLSDAFNHHVWATLRLIDACRPLDAEQLDRPVPGTYGSIISTLRHLVEADMWYLHVLSGGEVVVVDAEGFGLDELATTMRSHRDRWTKVLGGDLDPTEVIVVSRDDGSQSRTPLGVRLAQALHHGTDHRSQVCTGLTLAGVEPPEIDVWDFALEDGRLEEVPPPA